MGCAQSSATTVGVTKVEATDFQTPTVESRVRKKSEAIGSQSAPDLSMIVRPRVIERRRTDPHISIQTDDRESSICPGTVWTPTPKTPRNPTIRWAEDVRTPQKRQCGAYRYSFDALPLAVLDDSDSEEEDECLSPASMAECPMTPLESPALDATSTFTFP